MPESVLEEAARIIHADREDVYGDVVESFNRIAGMWTAYLGIEVSDLDVANLMILLKVSRTKGKYHRDSYVDIGGYSGSAERLAEGLAEAPEPRPEPREWLTLTHVPPGVVVSDKDRDQWLWEAGKLRFKSRFNTAFGGDNSEYAHSCNRYAPFTEVLGD